MSCKNNCRLCDRLVISTAVTVVTVGGTDTLVIDIPAATYRDCQRLCLVIAQAIPTTATIAMPVAISIGGDTTTVYPLVRCDCAQVTACAIRTRTRYPLRVSTNTVGGVFKVLKGLSCCPDTSLATLPVTAPAAGGAVAVASIAPTVTAARRTTTVKEGN